MTRGTRRKGGRGGRGGSARRPEHPMIAGGRTATGEWHSSVSAVQRERYARKLIQTVLQPKPAAQLEGVTSPRYPGANQLEQTVRGLLRDGSQLAKILRQDSRAVIKQYHTLIVDTVVNSPTSTAANKQLALALERVQAVLHQHHVKMEPAPPEYDAGQFPKTERRRKPRERKV